MAELSLVSTAPKTRVPVGNRFLVTVLVDEVTNGGADFVTGSTLGLTFIDGIVGVAAKESAVNVRAHENSQDFGSNTTNGSVSLQTSAGTHDCWLSVVGR